MIYVYNALLTDNQKHAVELKEFYTQLGHVADSVRELIGPVGSFETFMIEKEVIVRDRG